MRADYEDSYARTEESHPWFVERRNLFSSWLPAQRSARILDVGCGTGMLLVQLKRSGYSDLSGVEPSASLRERFRDPAIPLHPSLPEGEFDVVLMLDVLEHIDDDESALGEVYARLRPGGLYFISVPAHPFLWSQHDEDNQHRRRYTRAELREKLRAAGFRIRRMSYWNMFGFLPVAARRLMGSIICRRPSSVTFPWLHSMSFCE